MKAHSYSSIHSRGLPTESKKKKKLTHNFTSGGKFPARDYPVLARSLFLPARVFPWLRNLNTGREKYGSPVFRCAKNMADHRGTRNKTAELVIKRKQPSQGGRFLDTRPMFEIVNPIFMPPPLPPPPRSLVRTFDRSGSRTESEVSSFHVHNTLRETTGRVM